MFTEGVIKQLGYYVYRLIDPRNGQTFYVGKGSKNRVFSHAKGEVGHNENELSDKLKRIREIKNSGFEVTHVIHRHGLDEKTAFEIEAALIDAYPEATNIVKGHYADERGVMHAQQVIEQYHAREIDFQHKILMLAINRTALESSSVYEAVRYAWLVSLKKAQQAEFILAMQQGLVVGVFVAEQWLAANQENFPDKEALPGRHGFIGREAPAKIQELYLRTRLPDHIRKRGAANPVKYSF